MPSAARKAAIVASLLEVDEEGAGELGLGEDPALAAAGVLVDALHVARSGTTVEDIAAIPRELLHYAQICDGPALTPATHAEMIYDARENRQLPGEGGIALAPLFAALPADLPIAVEVPNFKRVATLGEDAWAGMAISAPSSSVSAAAIRLICVVIRLLPRFASCFIRGTPRPRASLARRGPSP